jgi:hypothetical protein
MSFLAVADWIKRIDSPFLVGLKKDCFSSKHISEKRVHESLLLNKISYFKAKN